MLPELSVFFPAHNEVENIKEVVRRALEVLPTIAREYEIIIVDDGSTDGTAAAADELTARNEAVRVIHHQKNLGYGGALKSGFKAAKKGTVFYSDADCQFDLTEIQRLIPLVEMADVACGFRLHRRDPIHRRINGLAYNMLIRLLFGVKFKDIDCAFKLIKKEVLDNIELKSNSQFICAEMLIKASKKGYSVKQIGVTHLPRISGKPSGNKPRAVINSFLDLFRLWHELK